MRAYNEIVLQDVFIHLTKLKADFAKLTIENNRNQLIVYAMQNFNNKIELIEQIIKSYDSYNFKSITNKINAVLLEDPELHCVKVDIKKSKCLPQIDKSKTALIIHLI
ncbi:hypothetical protein [Flavobacterium stagni]|uniref:Uncharacterized protein n=1 Tax=Flavobacterium stagni TaxID=2506421 RepID=A0A4Q1KDW6_9FLAO|nr:hypothetical protein [Flavobacterium stagni]RXR24674.1 hypothetical protein EQG61_04300 [Flavobacterium stagni]